MYLRALLAIDGHCAGVGSFYGVYLAVLAFSVFSLDDHCHFAFRQISAWHGLCGGITMYLRCSGPVVGGDAMGGYLDTSWYRFLYDGIATKSDVLA